MQRTFLSDVNYYVGGACLIGLSGFPFIDARSAQVVTFSEGAGVCVSESD